MNGPTKKQKRIAEDIKKEVSNIKESKAASSASPGMPSNTYKSNSVAGNSLVSRRRMGNVKSASGIGGSSKSGYAAKAGSGIKRMVKACNANFGCGASQ